MSSDGGEHRQYRDHFDFRGSTFHGPVTGRAESPRAAPSPTALSALPAAPAVFTGREEEVAELLGALDPGVGEGSESVVISAVAGLGGVGKTALALSVAHAARERGWFAGGALFVDLRGYDEVPVTADQAVLALLRALGVADTDLPPTADEQYACYRAELSSREPVLILLDNASDPAQIAPLLPGEGVGHRVLVTSREVQDSLPVRQFGVTGLTPDASRELVDRSLRRYDPGDRRVAEEPEAVRQLGALCGHLPLALLIVSALLRRRRQRPVSTLVGELQAASDRVRALSARGVDQYGKELSLRPVFDVMYARLEPELARVFRLLGQTPGDSIGIGPAANLTGLVPEQLEPLLEELTAVSLLTAVPGDRRWRMHDLVRLYARIVADEPGVRDEAAEGRKRLLGYYSQVALSAKAYIDRRPDQAPLPLFDDREHALQWFDDERTGLLAATQWTDTEDQEQLQAAMWLALTLESYLKQLRAFDDWGITATAACEAARKAGHARGEALAHSCLGSALHFLERFTDSEAAHRRALHLYASLGEREGLAMTWNNLGLTLSALGRHDDTIDAYNQSMRIYAELGMRRQAAITRQNLGGVLAVSGRLDESYDALKEALVTLVELGDKDGESAAQIRLGITLRALGRHAEAVTAFTRGLGLCAELGNWHGRAKAWRDLGLTWAELGLHSQALVAFTRARDWWVSLGASEDLALEEGNIAALREAARQNAQP
ncbi:tetratricopeptide repeat protein [Streptomyces sp. NPDC005885]|uniref:tetratricopeptide repeat protein n=1 Tax=Streptomyces sp. NPDC005885 TaxID=3157079 RepID=UPI0033CA8751